MHFATKPRLAREMIAAAMDAGVEAPWATGDDAAITASQALDRAARHSHYRRIRRQSCCASALPPTSARHFPDTFIRNSFSAFR